MQAVHLFALLAFSSQAFGADSQWTSESFSGSKFKVSWKYDKPRDVLMFRLDVQTTGWVGLGFTKTNEGMKELDVVVGGKTSGGKTYIHDLHSNETTTPPEDSTDNYNLTKAEEANGKTTLWFERPRITVDKDDHEFTTNTPIYLAYAFHDKDDALDAKTFAMHTDRGYSNMKYDLLMQAAAPNATAAATSPPTGADGDKSTPPPTSGEEKAASSFITVALSMLFLTVVVL